MLLTRSLVLSAPDVFASRTASPAVYGGKAGRGGEEACPHVISWLIRAATPSQAVIYIAGIAAS